MTGLPRSRTAWFSAWLDCKHEPTNGAYSDKELIDTIGIGGASDCMISWFDIRKHYPEAPVLVINRNIDDVMSSLCRILEITEHQKLDIMKTMIETQKRMLSIKNAMVVEFTEINENLREIWDHLMTSEYNDDRAKMFSNMKIELIDCAGDVKSFQHFVCLEDS